MTFATKLPATAAVVALLAVAAPRAALAFPTFRCMDMVDVDNIAFNFGECANVYLADKMAWIEFAFPVISALFLVVIVVSFPLCLLCRGFCACCCRSCFRASEKDGGKSQRCCLWMWVGYAFVIAFVASVMMLYGADNLSSWVTLLVDETIDNPLNYADCTAKTLIEAIDAVDLSDVVESFDMKDVSNRINVTMKDAREKVDDHIQVARRHSEVVKKWIALGSYAFGGLMMFFVLPVVALAWCRCCVSCLPVMLSPFYCLFSIAFMAISVAIHVVAYAIGVLCGELSNYQERKSGLIQRLSTKAKNVVDFDNIPPKLIDFEGSVAKNACEGLLKYCDEEDDMTSLLKDKANILKHLGVALNLDKDVVAKYMDGGEVTPEMMSQLQKGEIPDLKAFSSKVPEGTQIPRDVQIPNGAKFPNGAAQLLPALPSSVGDLLNTAAFGGGVKPLACGRTITKPEQCRTLMDIATLIDGARIKKLIPVCPPNAPGCTLAECAAGCTHEKIKEVAVKVTKVSGAVASLSGGLSLVRPLLEFDFIADTLLTALPNCGDIYGSVLILAVGFFLGGLMFGLCVYILLRGSCIWGERQTKKRDGSCPQEEANGHDKHAGSGHSNGKS
ncbi:unnamed protein product [Trypanosoma congolense IL3000]|uniref:WGS project CAEQ00000000 data, annotated contig 973 n=1 Tax=Trypanosoma congolense (strain IL3000) TaxID=1068625 RepID=F9WJZ9_TRYCI|nr:unnamed protein product [Trypanosoma congolense IL3000]